MEYYLVLSNELDIYPYDYEYNHMSPFNSSIIIGRDGKNVLINGKQTGYVLREYIAFCISDKYIIDLRDNISIKQYLIQRLNYEGISLYDITKFKRITAKEYYSLLD